MPNNECEICGGCIFRSMAEDEYRQLKINDFVHTLGQVAKATPHQDEPIFIKDGQRRRADMAFLYTKKHLQFGFNQAETHNIVNINTCQMLTAGLNKIFPSLCRFLEEFCTIAITVKNKKKIEQHFIRDGSVRLLEADNGIDIVLDIKEDPCLEHRLLAADFVNSEQAICRLSWAVKNKMPETIIEKYSPQLNIAGCSVEIPQDVFLQASKEAETKMIAKVINYMGETKGKIADLFCGLGTFTYPLAKIKENEIISADSYAPSLEGLKKALNRNQLQNVKVINRNLFKYPFDKDDMKGIKALVIDPPRAGAHEQCREIAKLEDSAKPLKIVFVSCNPKTFVYDAETLISAGYTFERVTLIDQFVYSKHEELVALFTFNPKNNKGE